MKNKNGKIEKALKPSQRKSITEFSSKFGTGDDFTEKMKRRKIMRIVFTVMCVILLVYFGFFFADTLIKITEIA